MFASFFIVLLKGTAQMMKNDVYSLFVSHLISFSSYRTFYILSCDVTSLTRNSGNNKKILYFGDRLIKFNETWRTIKVGATK